MARAISNVVISVDSFATWVGVTNIMADAFTNFALTANNSTIGAGVSGNSNLVGIFNANTVAVGDVLRGGTVNASANLNITSNALFTGANVYITSNTYIINTNTNINSTSFSVVTGSATVNTVTSSATFNANSGVANTTEIITTGSAHGFVNSDIVTYIVATGNTSIGGLANNTSYFVVNAVSAGSTLQLSTTSGGAAINITANVNETGHTLTKYGRLTVSGGFANITSNVNILNSNVYTNTSSLIVVG